MHIIFLLNSNADVDFEISAEDMEVLKPLRKSKATAQTVASRYTAEDYSFIGNEVKTDKRCSIWASFYYIIGIITILS